MRRLRQAMVVVLLLSFTAATVAALWAWRSGYRLYTVTSGSMEPTLHIGDAVLVRPSGVPSPGEVITFRLGESQQPITHRVVSVEGGSMTTKGDANDSIDTWSVQPSMVVGGMVARLPALGYVLIYLRQPTGVASLVSLVVAIAMLWRLVFPAVASAQRYDHAHRDLARLWEELTDVLEATADALTARHPVAHGQPLLAPAVVGAPAPALAVSWSEGTIDRLEALCLELECRQDGLRASTSTG